MDFFFGRSSGIRTRGLLDPNQARYQTSPCPDSQNIIKEKTGCVKWYGVFFLFRRNTLIQEVMYVDYHVIYGSESLCKRRWSSLRRFFFTTGFFICFLWLVCGFWPDGQLLLKQLLIPGDPEITLDAAEVFAQEIGSGFSLGDAIRNFCHVVLNRGYSD